MNEIYINEVVKIVELCSIINIPIIDFIKKLFFKGIIIKKHDFLNFEFTKKICKEIFNIEVKKKHIKETILQQGTDLTNNVFISITGNVNNGKTSFIEFVTKKKILDNELGHITQTVLTYNIEFCNKNLFFFDLPGHQLFNEVIKICIYHSDIIIYIISIDEDIDYKKINELVNISKNRNSILIICLNKCDKKKINNKYNFKNQFFISAKTGFNIKKVIKKVILLFNTLKKKIDFTLPGVGIIINQINKEINISTLFIYKGIVKTGFYLCFKNQNVYIDNLYFNNKKVDCVISPAIFEIKETILPIDIFFEIKKEVFSIENKIEIKKNLNKKINFYLMVYSHSIACSIYNYYCNLKFDNINILKILIGLPKENDFNYCKNFNCMLILIGFNKNINKNVFKEFNTVFEFTEFINKNYKCNLEEIIIGKLIIKNIFPHSKNNKIAGCKVIFGKINILNKIKIYNNTKILFEGYITTIKKKDIFIKEVFLNEDCGIQIKNFNNYEIGNIIISYILKNVKNI